MARPVVVAAVLQVMQDLVDHRRVEARLRERQRIDRPLAKDDPPGGLLGGQLAARDRQHALVEVDRVDSPDQRRHRLGIGAGPATGIEKFHICQRPRPAGKRRRQDIGADRHPRFVIALRGPVVVLIDAHRMGPQ